MERNNNPQSELTKSPWEWKWLGNVGNLGLLGQNGITFDGPGTADGRLKAAAPELLDLLLLAYGKGPKSWYDNDSEVGNQIRMMVAYIKGEAADGPH